MKRQLQTFHVGIKAFLIREGRLLLVRESADPQLWELPGGRIDVGEEALPTEEVLRREIREELGPDLLWRLEGPIVSWIRSTSTDRPTFTFLLGFLCPVVAGDIQLSAEHCELEWVDRDSWKTLDLAPGYVRALGEFWRRVNPVRCSGR